MKLDEAISDTLNRFGFDIIKTERFVNYLDDYRAFEVKQARTILREFLKAGYGEKIYQLNKDNAPDKLLKLKRFGKDLMKKHDFEESHVSYVINSICLGLGWIESPKDGKDIEVYVKNKINKEISKESFVKWKSIFAVSILFICIWAIALILHLNGRWEQCNSVLDWSAAIFLLSIFLAFRLLIEKQTALNAYIVFTVLTIISCLVYHNDFNKFRNCFWGSWYLKDYTVTDTIEFMNFENGDSYLSETNFHIFDSQAKNLIERKIKSCYELYPLNQYLRNNTSGFYVEETQKQLSVASDMLLSKAETLGDLQDIIHSAPEKYKIKAEKEYTRLDSIVWNDEELAYKNAKSLNSRAAYDKYLSHNFDNDSHRLEIKKLRSELLKFYIDHNIKN